MPPALSDEESASGDEIPYRNKDEADEGDEEVDEEGDEVYVVEKILSHAIKQGELKYEVKWQGYDKIAERTWEPEHNLSGAKDILQEYWDSIGGKPEGPAKGKKRKGRKSAAADSESGTPVNDSKRHRKEKEWEPPAGSWEHDVDRVDTVEEILDDKTGELARYAYLVWNNGKKTQHPLRHCYSKCPQKMLVYYESHLVFSHNNDDAAFNGDGQNGDDL